MLFVTWFDCVKSINRWIQAVQVIREQEQVVWKGRDLIPKTRFDTQNIFKSTIALVLGTILVFSCRHLHSTSMLVVLRSSSPPRSWPFSSLDQVSSETFFKFVCYRTIAGGTLFSYEIKHLHFVIMMLTSQPQDHWWLPSWPFSAIRRFSMLPLSGMSEKKSNDEIFFCWKKVIPTYLASCRISKCEIFNKF